VQKKTIMAGIISYVKESFEELKNHVSWTPTAELQRLTVVVLVFTILFSLAIWGADSVLSRIIKVYFDLLQ
jgi:preprotein translocase subunit SecE